MDIITELDEVPNNASGPQFLKVVANSFHFI